MAPERLAGILELDVAERILLVEAIWNSIAADSAAVPVTDAQRAELDHRLTAEESEAPTVGWVEVRQRLLLNRGRSRRRSGPPPSPISTSPTGGTKRGALGSEPSS